MLKCSSLLPRDSHYEKGLFSSNSVVTVSQSPAEIKQGICWERCCNIFEGFSVPKAFPQNSRMLHWVHMVLNRLHVFKRPPPFLQP